MANEHVARSSAGRALYREKFRLEAEFEDFGALHGNYCAGPNSVVMVLFTVELCVR